MRVLLRLIILGFLVAAAYVAYLAVQGYAGTHAIPWVKKSLSNESVEIADISAEVTGLRLFPPGLQLARVSGEVVPYLKSLPRVSQRFRASRISYVYPWMELISSLRELVTEGSAKISGRLEIDNFEAFISSSDLAEELPEYRSVVTVTSPGTCEVTWKGSVRALVADTEPCFVLPEFTFAHPEKFDSYLLTDALGNRVMRVHKSFQKYDLQSGEVATMVNELPYGITAGEISLLADYPLLAGAWYTLRTRAIKGAASIFSEPELKKAAAISILHFDVTEQFGPEVSGALVPNTRIEYAQKEIPSRYKEFALVGQIAASKHVARSEFATREFLDDFLGTAGSGKAK